MQQEAKITLTITFDNEVEDHPANWSWPELLDVAPDEVQVEAH